MYRKMEEELKSWKESPYRKPLVLKGPRQVGKTYTILEFGHREYDNIAYFNFENHPQKGRLNALFQTSIHPDVLIPALSALAGVPIWKERTLIVLDEIQLCKPALTSLKYFCENAPEYHVITAGSLLDTALYREEFSFPVGKINTKILYPMDFEEYLLAMGKKELIEKIRQGYQTNTPMDEPHHQQALDLYRDYLAVGGMPKCVELYKETRNDLLVRNRQNEILERYFKDMSSYNTSSQAEKIRSVFSLLAALPSQKNSEFQKKLPKSCRGEALDDALEWLKLSGLISQITQVEQVRKPLYANQDFSSYKLYYLDLGLLGARNDLPFYDIRTMSADFNDLTGGMAENYVNFHLRKNGYAPYFWYAKRGTQVDFVLEKEGKIIPVEVNFSDKSKARSLKVYMETCHPDYAIEISSENFSFTHGIKTIPFYALFCL